MDLLNGETPQQRTMKRLLALKAIRARWDPHYRELAEHILPRRIRISMQDFDKGEKINDTIINNAPLIAARVIASGMMAAITSPSRDWFGITTPDPEMAEFGTVRSYLHIVKERVRWAMGISNFYQSLSDGVYPDISIFGITADLGEQHGRRILHWSSLPIGEYCLSTNSDGEVDTVYREVPLTVRQVVNKFCQSSADLGKLSSSTKNSYDRGDYERVVELIHAVEPNSEFAPGRADAKGKRFSSHWMEKGAVDKKDQSWLEESGYHEFPYLCPRWSARGTEAYGRSPGMDALGDCKELQHSERRRSQLLDKATNPPMVGDEALRGSRTSLVAGDITYAPRGTADTFKPAFEPPEAAIRNIDESIQRIENRIDKAFFADLWLRVLSDERQQRATATEIEEGNQESMLQLGPVLERLNPELLRPAIDRFYAELERRGFLPPPPKELQGVELKVEFMSIMHQAQRMVGLSAVQTLVRETATLVQAGWTQAADKLNPDQVVDEIANMVGTKPELVLSDDEVAKVRQQRAQRQAQEQQAQQMAAAAQTAQTLGKTPVGPDNALGQMLNQLGPIPTAMAATPGSMGAA